MPSLQPKLSSLGKTCCIGFATPIDHDLLHMPPKAQDI